jgi:hypothetical protein
MKNISMRNSYLRFWIVLGLVFSLICVSDTYAAKGGGKKGGKSGKGGDSHDTPTPPTPEPSTDQPPPTPDPTPTPAPAVAKTNVVLSVDIANRKITVFFAEGNTNTYSISPVAKVNVNGAPASLESIVAGMRIEANTVSTDPKTLAQLNLTDLKPKETASAATATSASAATPSPAKKEEKTEAKAEEEGGDTPAE